MALDVVWPLTSDGAGAVTYTAAEWRTIVTALFSEGVLGSSSFAVTQRALGANMTLDIAAGVGILAGDDTANQGRYFVREDSATASAVTIATANATNPRIDLVGIQLNDPSAGGAAGREAVFSVVTGTPAASPAAPAAPDSFLVLAQVLVGAGVVSIVDANITDARVLSTLAHDVVDDDQATRLGTASIVNGAIVRRSGTTGSFAVPTPTFDEHPATKGYVDGLIDDAAGTLASGAIRYARSAGIVTVTTALAGWNLSSATLPAGFRPAAAIGGGAFSLKGGVPTANTVTISTGGVISLGDTASVTLAGFSISFAAA